APLRKDWPVTFLALHAAPRACRPPGASVGSPPPVLPSCASACVRLLARQARVPRAPNDRAAADGSPARPLPWLHCVHSHATTPTPPVYIDRCIPPCCEPASLTVSSCGLPFRF